MGVIDSQIKGVTGAGKVALATLAYPFAAAGTGIRGAVADAVGAARPTETAADAVAGFGVEGAQQFKEGAQGVLDFDKQYLAKAFGVTPGSAPAITPPVAATPKKAATPAPAATTAAPALPKVEPNGVMSEPAVKPYDLTGANLSVMPAVAVPKAGVKQDEALVSARDQLLSQINSAQQTVAMGSNAPGYKMGDVTKALALIGNLSPLVQSANNAVAGMYGTDVAAASDAAKLAFSGTQLATQQAGENFRTLQTIEGNKAVHAADTLAAAALNQTKHSQALALEEAKAQYAANQAAIKPVTLKDAQGNEFLYNPATGASLGVHPALGVTTVDKIAGQKKLDELKSKN